MDWLSEWLEPENSDVEDGEIITEDSDSFFHIPFPRSQPYLQTTFNKQTPAKGQNSSEQYSLLSTLHEQLHQLRVAMEQCTQTISDLLSAEIIELDDLLRILELSRNNEPLHRPVPLFERLPSANIC
jgi:hypothetical protein